MADYHFHGQVISRAQGRRAVAAAAYRSGEKLVNEKDGVVHDYTKKGGVVYTEIMLCENAPLEYMDRSVLWNAVEKSASSKDRLAREFDIALPIELGREEQISLVQSYVMDNFVKIGMCADIAIHDKLDGNPHAHVMLTMRPIDKEGKWEYISQKVYVCKDREGNIAELTSSELKEANDNGGSFEKQLPYFKNGKGKAVYITKHEAETDTKYLEYVRVKGKYDPLKTKVDRCNPIVQKWDDKDTFIEWRSNWALYQNREFEKKELAVRVDHRSYEEQGIDKIPTKHLGKSAKAMERRLIVSDRGEVNREIQGVNNQLQGYSDMRVSLLQDIDLLKERIETERMENSRTVDSAVNLSPQRIIQPQNNIMTADVSQVVHQQSPTRKQQENISNVSYDRQVEYRARRTRLADTKELANALLTIRRENITCEDDFEVRTKELSAKVFDTRGMIRIAEEKNAQYKEAAKHLETVKKHMPIKMELEKRVFGKRAYRERFESELILLDHAVERLDQMGVKLDVDVKKVLNRVLEQEREIDDITGSLRLVEGRLKDVRSAHRVVEAVIGESNQREKSLDNMRDVDM
jgi:ATP-dependent exoDNAse (exonuclease V), alpha subunit - helicase superfamily I member